MQIFNSNALAYQKVRAKITYPEKLYQYLNGLCKLHKSALDIGCGNGVSSIGLSKYFNKVSGIDLGENLIQLAQQNYPQIDFKVVDADDFTSQIKFDLITSATSFYWMNRIKIIRKLPTLLSNDGIFCAYKYDFPFIYGKLRDFINFELATKWQKYRDKRLIEYDDTYELLLSSNLFANVDEFIIPNVINLSPREIAEFFLSTSYVANYIQETKSYDYPQYLIEQIENLAVNASIKVRFDIYGTYAKNK